MNIYKKINVLMRTIGSLENINLNTYFGGNYNYLII